MWEGVKERERFLPDTLTAEVFPAKENSVWFLLAGLLGSALFHISNWVTKKSIVALKPYMYLFVGGTACKFNTESSITQT